MHRQVRIRQRNDVDLVAVGSITSERRYMKYDDAKSGRGLFISFTTLTLYLSWDGKSMKGLPLPWGGMSTIYGVHDLGRFLMDCMSIGAGVQLFD